MASEPPGGLAVALSELDGRCSGRLGVCARHLGTGEAVHWRAGDVFRTASTVKVAVHAAVLDRARAGVVDLDERVKVAAADLVGGSGVLCVLRPGARPTVADLCTLMIVVSDNTATNLLIDKVGGVGAVNEVVSGLGYPEVALHRRLGYPPPPLVAGPQPALPPPELPLGTATPGALCRMAGAAAGGELVDGEASARIVATMAHQQYHQGVPRAFTELTGPGEPVGRWPAVASKTGAVPGCRAEVGLLSLPGGAQVAYAVMADDLADLTMTALSEGDEVLGRAGAALLAHFWEGPGLPPLRPGWL